MKEDGGTNLDMKTKAQDRGSTTVMIEGHTLPVPTKSTTIKTSHEQRPYRN